MYHYLVSNSKCFKIGITSNEIHTRVNCLNSQTRAKGDSRFKAVDFFECPHAAVLEALLIDVLEPFRLGGDYFLLSDYVPLIFE
jgi:hypothetical protein